MIDDRWRLYERDRNWDINWDIYFGVIESRAMAHVYKLL